jgi:hypothetical protein
MNEEYQAMDFLYETTLPITTEDSFLQHPEELVKKIRRDVVHSLPSTRLMLSSKLYEEGTLKGADGLIMTQSVEVIYQLCERVSHNMTSVFYSLDKDRSLDFKLGYIEGGKRYRQEYRVDAL